MGRLGSWLFRGNDVWASKSFGSEQKSRHADHTQAKAFSNSPCIPVIENNLTGFELKGKENRTGLPCPQVDRDTGNDRGIRWLMDICPTRQREPFHFCRNRSRYSYRSEYFGHQIETTDGVQCDERTGISDGGQESDGSLPQDRRL